MKTKDWIILLTPILCNGVILAIFKELFERKIDEHIAQKKRHMIFNDQIYYNLLKALEMVCKIEVLFLKEEYNNSEYADFCNHISRMNRYVENFISDKKIKKEMNVLDEKASLFHACIGQLCLYDLKDIANSNCIVSSNSRKVAKQLCEVQKLIPENELEFMIHYEQEAKEADIYLNDIKQQIKKLGKII